MYGNILSLIYSTASGLYSIPTFVLYKQSYNRILEKILSN